MTKPGVRRVALLRGINVGGARTLPMADLRRIAASVGYRDVVTLGASGNVLYTSSRAPATDASRLASALAKRLGSASVVVRDARQLKAILRRDPFADAPTAIPDKWRFTAFLERPTRKPLPELPTGSPILFMGRAASEVFYTMAEPTSQAIALAGRLERSLGVSLTVRNWNVVRTLAERLSE